MMLLNERAMQAMLNDVNQVDYDIPGRGNILEEENSLEDEVIVPRKKVKNKEKDPPIIGLDVSLAIPLPKDIMRHQKRNKNLNLRRIAKQLDELVSS